jgi:hypothetical protein
VPLGEADHHEPPVGQDAAQVLLSFAPISNGRGLVGPRQQTLHYRTQTHKGHEQLEQVSQPTISNKSIDQNKADCSDHNDDQDANQN